MDPQGRGRAGSWGYGRRMAARGCDNGSTEVSCVRRVTQAGREEVEEEGEQ